MSFTDARVPVMVVTGFLGAGKTTLVNRILREGHGKRYAVVVNEFGEIGIDADLIHSTSEEVIELNNGCVCCVLRADLVRTLRSLLRADRTANRNPDGAGDEALDGIIIETTGLADPGPVIQTFFADQALAAMAFLDSVTTVVDAAHIARTLEQHDDAAAQIACADQIVLNKVDALSAHSLDACEASLRALNPDAAIHRTTRCAVSLPEILSRKAYRNSTIAEQFQSVVAASGHAHEPVHHGVDHACPADHVAAAHHDTRSGISSVSLSCSQALCAMKLECWLDDLLASHGQNILRAKGVVAIAGEPRKLVFQSVRMMLDGGYDRVWSGDEERASHAVFIGRNLGDLDLQRGFESCIA